MIPDSNHLRLTIRNVGDFTVMIKDLKPGTPVLLEGPFGTFTPVKDPQAKYLMIAGGVGITPIRSIIQQVAPNHELTLIYSNRSPDNVIFREELNGLSKLHNFPIYYFYTPDVKSVQPIGPNDNVGRLDEKKLRELVPDIEKRHIYVCGPIPMTQFLVKIVKHDLRIKGEQIHYEKFAL